MTNPGLLLTRPYPFARLRKLFEGIEPAAGKLKPISLDIGEPQHPLPECIRKAVTDNLDMMSHYPGTSGTAALREAIARWCVLRYGAQLDASTQILPVLGSREALFSFTQSHINASDPLPFLSDLRRRLAFGGSRACLHAAFGSKRLLARLQLRA